MQKCVEMRRNTQEYAEIRRDTQRIRRHRAFRAQETVQEEFYHGFYSPVRGDMAYNIFSGKEEKHAYI